MKTMKKKKNSPDIYFEWSDVLQYAILKTGHDPKKMKKFAKKLEKRFKYQEKLILGEIERLTGLKWKSKWITVCIIEGLYPSVPDPLLLNSYNWDCDLSLFQLIRMLIFNIMKENRIIEDSEKMDILTNKELNDRVGHATMEIAKSIFPEKKVSALQEKSEFG